ncbi:hypothetical protein OUZ56_027231 [Daphnia magna]|uniref:Uncharacterized protein n=1 Tax=Daphnia magna TaxID=35525 RepID=A0ABQ9ZP67_9CRUS|nr:hypothetical protein OUZ56_027231 [Daphnia magna]
MKIVTFIDMKTRRKRVNVIDRIYSYSGSHSAAKVLTVIFEDPYRLRPTGQLVTDKQEAREATSHSPSHPPYTKHLEKKLDRNRVGKVPGQNQIGTHEIFYNRRAISSGQEKKQNKTHQKGE